MCRDATGNLLLAPFVFLIYMCTEKEATASASHSCSHFTTFTFHCTGETKLSLGKHSDEAISPQGRETYDTADVCLTKGTIDVLTGLHGTVVTVLN